jgi:rod shape determining protein RodA
MINFRMLRLSDPWIWLSITGLLFISFLAIFSSTHGIQLNNGGDLFLYLKRQLLALIMAGLGLAVFAYLDYKKLKQVAWGLYFVTILILTVVLFSGSSAQGAQRWFHLGPFSFQPSEISKIFMIISLAAFLSDRQKIKSFGSVISLLLFVGLPFALVFKQPDLGTALVFIVILIGMLSVTEISPWLLIFLISPFVSIIFRPFIFLWLIYLLSLALALFLSRASVEEWVIVLGTNIIVGIAVPFIWSTLKAYQQQRILTFLNPAADPYGAGYHTLQSKIAIGSGGLWGKGFLSGTQTQLQFIPEQHSDFIFSVIGEEFGFIGSIFTLGLLFIFVWRSFVIAAQSIDQFGSLIASGIGVMTTFHLLLNIGMATGLLPVVGMPLPLISYGGSSLVMNLIGVGILQSIAMRRQKIIF